ncbi:putative DNA damage inducible protein, partial [Streptococcus pneumoniae 801]
SPIATPSHGSIVQKRGKLKNRKPIYRLKRKIGQKCNKHEAHRYYFSFRAAENATYSLPRATMFNNPEARAFSGFSKSSDLV